MCNNTNQFFSAGWRNRVAVVVLTIQRNGLAIRQKLIYHKKHETLRDARRDALSMKKHLMIK